MLEKINEFILKLARLLLKGENQNSKILLLMLLVPILGVMIICYLTFIPPIQKEAQFVNQMDFTEAIQQEDWKVLYSDPKPEQNLWDHCESDLSCPGNPKSNELFVNGFEHREKHVEKVSHLHGKRFWIGRIFPKEKLTEWNSKGAHQIILGYFYATIELFVNGERVSVRDWMTTRLPVTVDISKNANQDLYVAVRILHNMDEPFPDSLAGTGVVTDTQLEKHLRYNEFSQIFKPSVGIGFCFGLGILFFMFWVASPKRQEFAAYAAISLLQIPSQAMLIPFVWLHLGNYMYHRINYILAWYQVAMIIFLGLTISRIRTKYSMYFMCIAMILPWGLFLSSWTTSQFYENTGFVYNYFEWSSYFVAVFLIFSQARLVGQKRGELWDPYREIKLYLFAGTLITIALVQNLAGIASWDMRLYYTEFVISLFAIITVHEYRRQSNFVSASPVSKYHQIAKTIDALPCFALSIDLKNSESLFRYGAENGLGGSIVQKLMYHLSNIINDHGAELISSEGDSILLFLVAKDEEREMVLQKAMDLCEDLKKGLDQYLTLTKIPLNYELRIAMESGVIRPIWHDLGGKKLPGWEQVGASNVFVDLARMLEAESSQMPRSVTALVVKPEIGKLIKKFNSKLVFEVTTTTIKHGRKLELEMAKLSSY